MESMCGQRWREVEEYAETHDLTLGQAIRDLINKGLSHVDDD